MQQTINLTGKPEPQIKLNGIDQTFSENDVIDLTFICVKATGARKTLECFEPGNTLQGFFEYASKAIDDAANLNLISRQGMKAAGFPVSYDEIENEYMHGVTKEGLIFGALRHVFMQADRALNILNQPTSYTPRKTPLYNGKAEEGWKPLIP